MSMPTASPSTRSRARSVTESIAAPPRHRSRTSSTRSRRAACWIVSWAISSPRCCGRSIQQRPVRRACAVGGHASGRANARKRSADFVPAGILARSTPCCRNDAPPRPSTPHYYGSSGKKYEPNARGRHRAHLAGACRTDLSRSESVKRTDKQPQPAAALCHLHACSRRPSSAS